MRRYSLLSSRTKYKRPCLSVPISSVRWNFQLAQMSVFRPSLPSMFHPRQGACSPVYGWDCRKSIGTTGIELLVS